MASEPIIRLTDAAMNRAKELLANKAVAGLRIAISTKGCSGMAYEIDFTAEPVQGDEVVQQDGVTVFVDPKAVMFILGSEMDYTEDKFYSGFTFSNPNEKGRCGCGESFHI
jgi:iron-sulfur cluster assembly protein